MRVISGITTAAAILRLVRPCSVVAETSNSSASSSSDDDICVDSALDLLETPRDRAMHVLETRQNLVETEYKASRNFCQDSSNNDWSSAARFHKTLPHDDLGMVVPEAFDALLECVTEGSFDKCEAIPKGHPSGFLANPLGGLSVGMTGPASTSVGVPAAPALNSIDLAAQLVEVYWMSLTRDVPFSKYGEDEDTIAAAANLAAMPGFGRMNGVSMGPDGTVDPFSQLFRCSFVGVETGPFISQVLVHNFSIDSILVKPKQETFEPGIDYMTDYGTWLRVQDGGDCEEEELDDQRRYIRNGRDLSRLVATDTIYTEFFRGALILMEQGAISRAGFNGPYTNSQRQAAFVDYGVSHLMKTFASLELSQKASWYQKWNVHLFARPEAVGGTLHNVLHGLLDVDLDESLTGNEELLNRVVSNNAKQNRRRGKMNEPATYLLSQATQTGSPTHPSYPAGHAVQSGAFATVLKAFVGLERGEDCFTNPVFPDDSGLELLDWDGSCLTYEVEINKLATNIAFGRQIMGVHYRFDSHEGLLLGQTIAIRVLHQELVTLPEEYSYEFRLFTGETIMLEHDGGFRVDGKRCSGVAFTGVQDCE